MSPSSIVIAGQRMTLNKSNHFHFFFRVTFHVLLKHFSAPNGTVVASKFQSVKSKTPPTHAVSLITSNWVPGCAKRLRDFFSLLKRWHVDFLLNVHGRKNENTTWIFMNSDSRSWSIIISIYSLWHYCTRSATCVAFGCKGTRHRPINDDILHERLRDGILRMICVSSAISSKICDTVTSSSDSTIRSEMISFKFCVIGISTICLSIRSETYVSCFDQRVTLCCSITIFSNLIISLQEWF